MLEVMKRPRIALSIVLFLIAACFFGYSLSVQPLVGGHKFVTMHEGTERIYQEGDPTSEEAQETLIQTRERMKWLSRAFDNGRDTAVLSSLLATFSFFVVLILVVTDPQLRQVSSKKTIDRGEIE